MDFAKRLEQKKDQLVKERNKLGQERLARKEALNLMKASQEKEKGLANDLENMGKKGSKVSEKLTGLEESL